MKKITNSEVTKDIVVKNKGGRPCKYKEPEEMQIIIDKYFDDETNEPFNKFGLALALNLTTEGLREYGLKPMFSAIVTRATMRMGDYTYRAGAKGEIKERMASLNLKCNYGWTETTKVEHKIEQIQLPTNDLTGDK